MQKHWEHFSHEADMGIRGYGNSIGEAFEQAALALMAVVTDLPKIESLEVLPVRCSAGDYEMLFVEWLNVLIYEMSTRRFLFNRFDIEIANHELYAMVWGESIDRDKHQIAVEIKGATYTALRVVEEKGQWIAQCVVDV